ncbi:MAG: DUF4395 domain-containing protein [Bacillaceae bacterium]|uniref:DUF4395 domain-containing protein n=1 Tax=Aeribacillus TaxID=1055323 RepID=UPI000E3A3BB9|nr:MULTISPECIES: DUF4395 domain-containing protein [Aeribacillus]REJ22389.1 MAG: DUF4395 domain-containing protein [Bacillaceae bacterium]RZI52170.1 DUF4395 domain-containing protein [Aeribacillus pallidus]TVZ77935.1 uncharacterized protein DUF4395 [Aeribacillus composti]
MDGIPRPLVRTNQWTIVLSVLITWITHEPLFLLIPLIAGLIGLIFGVNPIMAAAKTFLRKPHSSYHLEDRSDQQFNQIIACTCLLLAFIGFSFHIDVLGYIFSILVFSAAFIAILGFCIGCFIRFQWKQYQYRKAKNS